MNKNTILKLAPNILKRMEYSINVFYLLNLDTDEIWTGNYSSFLIIQKINGTNTIENIINELIPEFEKYTYEDLYNSTISIFDELLEKKFLLL